MFGWNLNVRIFLFCGVFMVCFIFMVFIMRRVFFVLIGLFFFVSSEIIVFGMGVMSDFFVDVFCVFGKRGLVKVMLNIVLLY